MKMKFLTLFGALGGLITSLFGGWDAALVTLLIFMGVSWYGQTSIRFAEDYTFNPRYRFRQAKISCRRGIASPLGT